MKNYFKTLIKSFNDLKSGKTCVICGHEEKEHKFNHKFLGWGQIFKSKR